LTKILVEASVETLEEAVAAEEAGADRVELCADLAEDGLTPEPAVVASAVEASAHSGVHDTCVREPAISSMTRTSCAACCANVRAAGRAGLAGVVTGVLSADGNRWTPRGPARLVEAAAPLPVTFHRCVRSRGRQGAARSRR
jgi:copper homeostasis protein